MQQATLQVLGMSCEYCVNSVKKALKEIGASGHVDLKGKSVTVDFDGGRLSLETVKEAIEDLGYDVV